VTHRTLLSRSKCQR